MSSGYIYKNVASSYKKVCHRFKVKVVFLRLCTAIGIKQVGRTFNKLRKRNSQNVNKVNTLTHIFLAKRKIQPRIQVYFTVLITSLTQRKTHFLQTRHKLNQADQNSFGLSFHHHFWFGPNKSQFTE